MSQKPMPKDTYDQLNKKDDPILAGGRLSNSRPDISLTNVHDKLILSFSSGQSSLYNKRILQMVVASNDLSMQEADRRARLFHALNNELISILASMSILERAKLEVPSTGDSLREAMKFERDLQESHRLITSEIVRIKKQLAGDIKGMNDQPFGKSERSLFIQHHQLSYNPNSPDPVEIKFPVDLEVYSVSVPIRQKHDLVDGIPPRPAGRIPVHG